MTNTMQTAKELSFGTELEYTNISRERAVQAIHTVVGGTIRYTGGGFDEWTVIAPDGRHWKAICDISLGSSSTSAEVVTPILKWDDLDTLQAVVRELRKAGAKTGMHQPARPHRSRRFQRPADRKLRADFLQAGRTPPQGGRNLGIPPSALHPTH